MDITITGTKNRYLNAIIREAAEFYADILIDPRMSANIILDIDLHKKMDVQGDCVNEDGTKNPRWFTINLRNCKEDDIIETLAHEMVHVKQYAKNELGYRSVATKGKGRTFATHWMGEEWKPRGKEDPYFDSPWEVEAFGRGVGLYDRFLRRNEK